MLNSYQKKYKFSQIQKQDFNFQLLDEQKVFLTGPFQAFTNEVKQLIKQNQGYFQTLDGEKGWTVPINQYQNLINNLRQLNQEIIIKQVPALLQRLQNLNMKEIKYLDNGSFITLKYEKQIVYEQLNKDLNDNLYQYQRDCIKQGIKFNGRILIADEMGVGKTVQSLALASLYDYAWPLLIVCPSALRLNWQDEIIKWLRITKSEIQLINSGKDAVRLNAKIVIVSYDICSKIKDNLIARKFQICIADECHYLKSPNSIRSQVCVPILRQCLHVILLTGTPALSKPRDLFNLMNMIRPDIFSSFKEYGYRYCDPKLSRFVKGIDFDGASNLKELHFLLTNYIMIRRLKKDVLSQLPEKRRIKVRIQGESGFVKQIGALIKKLGNIDIQSLMNKEISFAEKFNDQNDVQINVNSILMKCYQLTGQAKIKGIKEYISTLLENDIKFLFFAHHLDILDAVEEFCIQNEVLFIRIDGNVSNEQRHENVKKFQEDNQVRVAILSVTSANFGITLTASSTIIFGEMHWTPAVMLQAEDRAHRIGQQQCVDCHYLIGDGTLDDHIFQKIESKMTTVSNFIDGQKKNLGALEFQSKDIIINQKLSKQSFVEQQQNCTESPKSIYTPKSIKSLSEEELEEIYRLIDSQEQLKKEENDKQQSQEQAKQILYSDQVKQQSNQLKQTLIDKFLKSSQVKKEIIEDNQTYNQIYKAVQNHQTLNFGAGPQKLGLDYLKDRLGNESKETESGKKRVSLKISYSPQQSVIKINPNTQQLN